MKNKFIKTDLENAEKYMKSAIMNALYDIDNREIDEIDLGPNISSNLLYDCLKEASWTHDCDFETNEDPIEFWNYWVSPSGRRCTIKGFPFGQNYKILCN